MSIVHAPIDIHVDIPADTRAGLNRPAANVRVTDLRHGRAPTEVHLHEGVTLPKDALALLYAQGCLWIKQKPIFRFDRSGVQAARVEVNRFYQTVPEYGALDYAGMQ